MLRQPLPTARSCSSLALSTHSVNLSSQPSSKCCWMASGVNHNANRLSLSYCLMNDSMCVLASLKLLAVMASIAPCSSVMSGMLLLDEVVGQLAKRSFDGQAEVGELGGEATITTLVKLLDVGVALMHRHIGHCTCRCHDLFRCDRFRCHVVLLVDVECKRDHGMLDDRNDHQIATLISSFVHDHAGGRTNVSHRCIPSWCCQRYCGRGQP